MAIRRLPRQDSLPLPPRAYGYVRVSTPDQAESGLSIDEQQTKIRARCLENGWNLEKIYVDAGVSGGIPLGQRPEGERLLRIVRPGDVVVAAKMDRMFRSAANALHVVEDFKKRKISLWLLDLGNDCSGNGISELIVTILAAVAQFERGLISERIKDAKRAARRDGLHLGGTRQFGYDIAGGKLVPNALEQDAIARMRRLRKRGRSLMVIRNAVRKAGVPISHETVRQVLARPEPRR
jgi:putative DNA-invertase from lambdoid prophage Rac